MSIINTYDDAPYFVGGVEFSGRDGNILRSNAIFLDALVQQPIPIFSQGMYKEGYTGMTKNPTTGEQPYCFRGGFRYLTGVNTATYVFSSALAANERLRIYHRRLSQAITDLNAPGTLVYDAIWPTGAFGVDIDMSAAGYTNGEIIESYVQVYFPGPTYPKTGYYQTRRAYTHDLSSYTGLGSYPGLPVFGDLTATNLNQLSNAQDWLIGRLALVPRAPFEAGLFALGTHKSDANQNPRVIYVGWMNKGNGQDTMHGIIDYYSFNGQEYIRVYVNGVLEYTSPLLTNGMHGTLDFTFSVAAFADNADYSVVVEQYVVPGQSQFDLQLYGATIIDSRFSIRKMEVTTSRSYYSPSAKFDILESMTYLTLKNRLANFTTGTGNAKTAIDGAANLFNRAMMFRRKFGWDAHQVASLEWVNLPTAVRVGEKFIVAGKGVKIAWGGYTLKQDFKFIEDPSQRDIYEFANSEDITGSDKVEVKEVYFDKFEGLYPGVQYYLLGNEISFFSEYLR